MTNPQTYAISLQKNLKNIADYGCCALTVLWWAGINTTDEQALSILNDAINDKVIDADCTVKWVPYIQWLTGREITVEFQDITSIKNIKERTPVKFSYNGKSHWVGVENGKVVFNPLVSSVCVDKGKPVTARRIKFK